jgi:tetratricopeptide (TPR) repeat protein
LQLYLSRYGGDTSARETLGGIYDEDRQYQAALEQADMALSLNPSSAQAQLLRSRALMGLGRTAQARREIEKGLESGALSGEFSLQRGFLELAEGKYAEAETSFRKAYQAGNRDLRAVSGLVEVAFARQQPAAAVKIAQGELAKSEAPEAARAWVASVAARAGQYDLAMREYQTAIAKRPDDANLYLALGEMQRRKGDGEAAQKAFAAAKAKAPESSAPELALGLEALGGKDWASAERHFRRAVEIDAASVAAKNNLAYALAEQNKNLDEALRLAIQASAGKNPNYEDTLAYVYLKRRDFGAALRIWERLAAQAPKAFGLQLRMAEARWGMGDKEGAARILEGVEKTAMSNEERALVARMRGQMR